MTRQSHILALALQAADQRRRRRRAVRITAGSALLAAVAGLLWTLSPTTPATQPSPPIAGPTVPKTDAPPPRPPAVTIIATVPTRHVRVIDTPDDWQHVMLLDDDELLDALAAVGLDAGLAYVDGKVVLLPRGWSLEP